MLLPKNKQQNYINTQKENMSILHLLCQPWSSHWLHTEIVEEHGTLEI